MPPSRLTNLQLGEPPRVYGGPSLKAASSARGHSRLNHALLKATTDPSHHKRMLASCHKMMSDKPIGRSSTRPARTPFNNAAVPKTLGRAHKMTSPIPSGIRKARGGWMTILPLTVIDG